MANASIPPPPPYPPPGGQQPFSTNNGQYLIDIIC